MLKTWPYLNLSFAVNSVNLAWASDDSLSDRYFLISINIEAFSFELWMLIQYDLYNQVTEVSIESLVAFLFYSKEHTVADTLRNLTNKIFD